jgi:hypothetical protein
MSRFEGKKILTFHVVAIFEFLRSFKFDSMYVKNLSYVDLNNFLHMNFPGETCAFKGQKLFQLKFDCYYLKFSS